VIRSPIDGMVISRSVDVGQTVAASLQAPTLFTIAENLVKMQINTSIDEGDIGKVQPGQQANFTVSSYPGEVFTGRVTQVRNEPKTEQNVVTYDAIIAVDNPDLKLKPGMTATVSIIIDKREDVKTVLNAALNFKPESADARKGPAKAGVTRRAVSTAQGGNSNRVGAAGLEDSPRPPGEAAGASARTASTANRRNVWILSDGAGPQAVTVEVGITDGTRTEIKGDALQEGQEVIVGLSESQKDRPTGGRPPSFGRFF